MSMVRSGQHGDATPAAIELVDRPVLGLDSAERGIGRVSVGDVAHRGVDGESSGTHPLESLVLRLEPGPQPASTR
jgi:hypothetical protein